MQVNPYQPGPYQAAGNNNTGADQDAETIRISRELDGRNDTGVIGEMLTIGTEQISETNRLFSLSKFAVSSLLAEDNQVLPEVTMVMADNAYGVLCEDDMYVAGDPLAGGKGNNYQPVTINPAPGFYTMLEDGRPDGPRVTVNAHVDTINNQGDTAFTQYGFIVENEAGQRTRAVLSGGQLLVTDPQGNQFKLLPGQEYIVGDPNDPQAKFYYDDVPGGENGVNEPRLVFESYEKPSPEVIADLMGRGVDEAAARGLRSTTRLTFGFRVPDGQGSYRMPDGVGGGASLPVTNNGVKTYYDAHFYEGECHVCTVAPPVYYPPDDDYTPPPPPEYPETPPPVYDYDPGDDYETPPDYDGGDYGNYWGDPHFVGFDGGKYDVQGEAGKVYNILSDQNIQYNARFETYWRDKQRQENGQAYATVIGEVGIKVGDDQLRYSARDGQPPSVNGQPLAKGQTVTMDAANPDGATTVAYADDGTLSVTTPEYTIKLNPRSLGDPEKAHFNSDVSVNENGPFRDLVAPHGLLGQTADGDGEARTGDTGKGKQGGGALEVIDDQGNRTLSDKGDLDAHRFYEVSDIFADDFAFNRFGAQVGEVKAADFDGDGTREVFEAVGTDGSILFRNPGKTLEEYQSALAAVSGADVNNAELEEELQNEAQENEGQTTENGDNPFNTTTGVDETGETNNTPPTGPAGAGNTTNQAAAVADAVNQLDDAHPVMRSNSVFARMFEPLQALFTQILELIMNLFRLR